MSKKAHTPQKHTHSHQGLVKTQACNNKNNNKNTSTPMGQSLAIHPSSHLCVGRMGILLGLGNGVFIIHVVIVTFIIVCDVVVVYVCHILHHIHNIQQISILFKLFLPNMINVVVIVAMVHEYLIESAL